MVRRVWLVALLLSNVAHAQTESDEPGMAPAPPPPPPASQPAPTVRPTPPPASRPVGSRYRDPAPLADQWYYAVNDQRAGPFSLAQLRGMIRTGLLPSDALIWRPGFEDWLSRDAVPELADLSRVRGPDEVPPRPGERRRIRGLVIGGAITFGVTWGIAVVSSIGLSSADGCSDCDEVTPVLWIPLAGPLIADAVDSTDSDTETFVMALWTVAQTAGATMLVIGLIGRKTPESQESTSGWHLTPLVGQVNGIGLSTTF
jgi:hypothetical protein